MSSVIRRLSARLGKLRHEQQGNAALITVAAIVMFGMISAGIGASLQQGIRAQTNAGVNALLSTAVQNTAARTADKGLASVRALPPSANVNITVGARTVSARRTVTIAADGRSAEVRIAAGRFNGSTFSAASACAATPARCVVAAETTASTADETAPQATVPTESMSLVSTVPAAIERIGVSPMTTNPSVWAQTADGTTFAWGDNTARQITDATTSSVGTTRFDRVADAADVQISGNVSAVVTKGGDLYTWGLLRWGFADPSQAGDGTYVNTVTAPMLLDAPVSFTRIWLTGYAVIAMDTNGRLWAAGGAQALMGGKYNSMTQLSTLQFTDIATVGIYGVYGVTSDGRLMAWGTKSFLPGTPDTAPVEITTPVQVALPAGVTPARVASNNVSTASGVLMVSTAGQLYGAGRGTSGQMGIPTSTTYTTFTLIPSAPTNVASVHGDNTFKILLDKNGDLWGAGQQSNGSFATDSTSTTPIVTWTRIPSDRKYTQAAAVGGSVFAVAEDGGLYTWGRNLKGIGSGVTTQAAKRAAIATMAAPPMVPKETPVHLMGGSVTGYGMQVGVPDASSVSTAVVVCRTDGTVLSETPLTTVNAAGYRYGNVLFTGLADCADRRVGIVTDGGPVPAAYSFVLELKS